jgi:hypothetical protein
LILSYLIFSKDDSQVSQLRTQMSFFTQFSAFSVGLKSDLAGSVSRVDEPAEEMYRYQWGV